MMERAMLKKTHSKKLRDIRLKAWRDIVMKRYFLINKLVSLSLVR